jgi:hypothetical protein
MSLRFVTRMWLIACLFGSTALVHAHGEPPRVQQLQIQEVGPDTFFYVRFENPKDLIVRPNAPWRGRWWDDWLDLDAGEAPQLIPRGGPARKVYLYIPPGDIRWSWRNQRFMNEPGATDRATSIEFYGKLEGKDAATAKASFLLTYPKTHDAWSDKKTPYLDKMLFVKDPFVEVEASIDFANAERVAPPAKIDANAWPVATDLKRRWAIAEVEQFAALAARAPDFGFYSFAMEATTKQYALPRIEVQRINDWTGRNRWHVETRDLYNVTTGAAAITESLALNRMRDANFRGSNAARTVDIRNVQGITIGEHPWEKMMAGKKPGDEPLAKLTPHDFYYIHFKNIAKFLEMGDLIEQWGTTATRAFESNSKDNRLKQKIEQQLCLKSTGLARVFGPQVIKSMAVVGSDPYVREGTDITILFQLSNKSAFQLATEPILQEARKKFGAKLKEGNEAFGDIAIESYTTPLREVSLHRASFGEFVAYSNSPAALRRVLETHLGKHKSLWDSLDFQYMRVIFKNDDPQEDGFVFLSDAFIRNLVGPATRIKERRRLEALTSLAMVTNGALYTAWHKGRLPLDHAELLASTGLKPEQLFTPDGNGAAWDPQTQLAVSNVYNTHHFATPLLEIPIDFVTKSEASEYEMFRQQYMGLWRQFFDPIGMRVALRGKEVKWETYILPLVRNTQYDQLRRTTGDGVLTIDGSTFSDKAIFQVMAHVSPNAWDAGGFGFGDVRKILGVRTRDLVKDWVTLRFDDSPVYAELLEMSIRRELDPNYREWGDFLAKASQMPVTVGFEIRNPLIFAGLLTTVRNMAENAVPNLIEWKAMEPYKDVKMVRIGLNTQDPLVRDNIGNRKDLDMAVYYVLIDGAFYAGLRPEPIRDIIDRSIARRDGKLEGRDQKSEVNSALHISPAAMNETKKLVGLYMEWEAHKRAQSNNRVLYALYHSGLIGTGDSAERAEATAFNLLGYVPVSPDLSPYRYEAKTDEVVNTRHGSPRHPRMNRGVDNASPLGQLIHTFASLRADLRFREDGIHTTLTLKRK